MSSTWFRDVTQLPNFHDYDTVSADISNTGRVAGVEVVQFYVQASGKQQRPLKQLAGFQRVTLQAREKQTVSFSLAHDHLALRYWDDSAGEFAYEPGTLQLMVGSSSMSLELRGHVDLV